MVENQSESIPINGMKMTFPTHNNYALRFFKLFDMSKICPNKHHIVLDILENLLKNTEFFYHKKKNEDSQFCIDFANSIHSDLKLYEDLVENLLIIDKLEVQENDIYNKRQNKIKELSRSFDILIEKNSSKIQSKPSIYDSSVFYFSLREKLNFLGNSVLESDIRTTVDNLKKSRDKVEIFIMSALCQILLIKEEVSSKEVYEVVKDFSKLKKRLESFSNSTDFVFNFKLPFREMINIITIVDPILSNHLSTSKKYSHLSMVTKWILAALEIIFYYKVYQEANKYFLYSLRELELYGKILNLLNSESQNLKIIIDRKENLDTIRKLVETINEMKKFVQNTIEEEKINGSNTFRDYNEEFLNNSLLKERQDLNDLYSNFTKGVIQNTTTSYNHQFSKGSNCFCFPNSIQNYYCFNKIN